VKHKLNKILQTTQVNLYSCDKQLIGNEKVVKKFLENLVQFIGMNKINPALVRSKNPAVFNFESARVERPNVEDGVTGVIILYESHCSIHTWPADEYSNFACVLIHSCKEYDSEKTVNFCKDFFKAEKVQSEVITM
jgi:S-adenosylmethionine decarboxylase